MREERTFLPASLRPAPQTLRPRGRLLIRSWLKIIATIVVCVGVVSLLAQWRIDVVEVNECTGLPASAAVNLTDLRGRWIPAVDLEKIRQDVERWPGIAGASIELKLPATLRVRALADEICASVPMGRTWRGVTCNGHLSHRLSEPRLPILEGFNSNVADLRSALSTGTRLCDGTTGRLLSVRKITPSDYEVTIGNSSHKGTPSVARVLPQGTPSEQWWRTAVLNGQAPAWADLRLGQRIVIRRVG